MNGQNNNNTNDEIINLLLADGLENSLPKIAEFLIDTAMLLERIQQIGAFATRGTPANAMAMPTDSNLAPSRLP